MTNRPAAHNSPKANLLPQGVRARIAYGFWGLCAIVLATLMLASSPFGQGTPAIKLSYQVLQTQALATPLFTQGLEIHQNQMLFSSGLYGKSTLLSRPLTTLNKNSSNRWQHKLNKRYFAEGLTVLNNTLYLLSWREHTLWRFDATTGKPLASSSYKGEGWGLTHNGQQLIRSDGSSTLFFHAPDTFAVQHRLTVTRNGRAVKNINELEYAHGLIWANVWLSDEIIAIDPANGEVKAVLDIAELSLRERSNPPDPDAVANGIAYDAGNDSFWLTGKRWSNLYQVRINTDALQLQPQG